MRLIHLPLIDAVEKLNWFHPIDRPLQESYPFAAFCVFDVCFKVFKQSGYLRIVGFYRQADYRFFVH